MSSREILFFPNLKFKPPCWYFKICSKISKFPRHQLLEDPWCWCEDQLNFALQVTRLALMNSKLSQSLSLHNLATSLDSDSDNSESCSTPQALTVSPSQSSLALNLRTFSGSCLSLQRTNSNQLSDEWNIPVTHSATPGTDSNTQ